jgi:hypothetical protein
MGKRHTGLKPRSEQLLHISLQKSYVHNVSKPKVSFTTKSDIFKLVQDSNALIIQDRVESPQK